MGFNTVKIPFNWRLLADVDDTGNIVFKEEGFKHIDRILKWCKKYGLFTVLALQAAPGGQTGTNIDDSLNNRADFFREKKYRDQTIALWGEIARRYQSDKSILIYSLLGEPLANKDEEELFINDLESVLKEITKAIREYDNSRIISLQGPVKIPSWSMFDKPFDENLIYEFHYFGEVPTEKTIRDYLQFRDQYNVPVWCGDTGENRNFVYQQTLKLLFENQIGWSFWPWKKTGSANNPVSLPMVKGWNKIQGFQEGEGKLSPEEGKVILDDYLEALLLENCIINQEVVDTLFPPAMEGE